MEIWENIVYMPKIQLIYYVFLKNLYVYGNIQSRCNNNSFVCFPDGEGGG